jgi:hypothetical protein
MVHISMLVMTAILAMVMVAGIGTCVWGMLLNNMRRNRWHIVIAIGA